MDPSRLLMDIDALAYRFLFDLDVTSSWGRCWGLSSGGEND